MLLTVSGHVRALLAAERSALNIASRASGIATATRAWVDAVAGAGAVVLDTRKTTPLLRPLEKYAVRCGGGWNKRMGLYDVAMIKDNHVAAAGSVAAAVAAVRERAPRVTVQVEATRRPGGGGREGRRGLPAAGQHAARRPARGRGRHGRPRGDRGHRRADPRRGPEVAATGVDYLSVGALTYSSPILDLALDLRPA